MFLGSWVIGGEFKISVYDRKTVNWWNIPGNSGFSNVPKKPLHLKIDETHAR